MFGLLYIFLLLSAYVALLRLIIKKVHDKRFKYLLLSLAVAVPAGDEIIGRIYFEYLCATKTGIHVYQTVTLPSSYWDATGEPIFLEANGNYHLDNFPPKGRVGTYNSTFHVDNSGYSIIDRDTGDVLGDDVSFRYWGGWLRRELSSNNVANSCGGRHQRNQKLIRSIFRAEWLDNKINRERTPRIFCINRPVISIYCLAGYLHAPGQVSGEATTAAHTQKLQEDSHAHTCGGFTIYRRSHRQNLL